MNKVISKLFNTNPIKGNFVHLYHIDVNDSEKILKLRLEERDDNFLMATDDNLERQIEYYHNYKTKFDRKEEIYFKIFDVSRNDFSGFVRLTNINSKIDFNWESAILDKKSSPNLFLDLMLIIYSIGFNVLGREVCGPWRVKKDFKKMMKIHALVGMVEIAYEDEEFYYVQVKKRTYEQKIKYFSKKHLGTLLNLEI
jgi:hypothetical protein